MVIGNYGIQLSLNNWPSFFQVKRSIGFSLQYFGKPYSRKYSLNDSGSYLFVLVSSNLGPSFYVAAW